MPEKEPFLFISYSHTDKEFAVNFSKRLTRAGIKHFRDVASIRWGESIPRRVREGLESATHLVVLISPGSAESQWVAYEMGYAHGRNVDLVPYLLHPSMKIPGFIANLRCMVTRKDEADFINSIKDIIANSVATTKQSSNDTDVLDNIFAGYYSQIVSEDIINKFHAELQIDNVKLLSGDYAPRNSFIRLIDQQDSTHTAIGRFSSDTGKLVPVIKVTREGIWSIFPRNFEQACALDLLINDEVLIVSFFGSNRSRKRLLALAAGLNEVAEKNKFNRLIISRPIVGLLASEARLFEESGLTAWMQPYFDNFEYLLSGEELRKNRTRGYKELMAMGILNIEPLSGIFGRCIEDAYIIIDDVQFLTSNELKELIAAVGERSKLILLSDEYPRGSEIINVVNRLKGQKDFGHLSLSNVGSETLFDRIGELL